MAQQQKLGYAWWNLQVVHVLLMLENNILLSHKETYKVTQQGFPFFFQKGCTMTQSMLVSTWSRRSWGVCPKQEYSSLSPLAGTSQSFMIGKFEKNWHKRNEGTEEGSVA